MSVDTKDAAAILLQHNQEDVNMDDYNEEMFVLKDDEMDAVAGGFIQLLGVVASVGITYKQAYETANFYGATQLGNWIGIEVYDMLNNKH